MLAALAISAAACVDFLFPNEWPASTAFDPPPIYQIWWDELQLCSGKSGNLADVGFFQAHVSSWRVGEYTANAAYWPAAHRIVIGDTRVLHPSIVRHEMLHALTRKADHGYNAFLRNCKDYVTCSSLCAKEAGFGRELPAGLQYVADSFEVSMRVVPGEPEQSATDGLAVIVITVRNPRPYGVVVPPATERIVLNVVDASGATLLTQSRPFSDGLSRWFEPQETRRFLFDLSLKGPSGVPRTHPVRYRAIARFATYFPDTIEFTIRP